MLKEPESIDQCVYFTNRTIDNGKIKVWVLKENCSKCGKCLMSKPKDPKTGKIKIRAKEYVCPECGYEIEQKEYEESLTASINYTCPYCDHSDEIQIPFKRKRVQRVDEMGKKETVEALRFQCSKCNENIDVTKKMK